ncbi:cyclin-T2b [Danio rerio]|uniref:Cyclin-T2b n=1 Tax=Danio rerio TaxID=7955 RepID=Q802D2_DANRE|nr:cyclin-T2b [Danio rerio]AAH48886.1 Zgc:55690 [Danio rerio]AAI64276.1 Zgc:55690 protein [Danio rerio]|eukprot:NP_997751.1 cyclin-T2 [Danio rerio]
MMAAVQRGSSKWLFTREQFENTPSRRCGVEPDRELSYRQQAANLIQDMGQRLNVSQLTINTAIVYMHRFYMLNSFTKFHRNIISPTTLFLAAKVEEQPRKLEHVIKVAHACLNPHDPPLDSKSSAYLQQAQELVLLETIVLQTLGFEITIEHPHTDVVRCTQLVRASKDLAQTSYFMATNSLHLTTFCLQHKPTVVACVCIHLACKWSNWEIPVSSDGKHWWEYVDRAVTLQLLDDLTHEFLQILEKTPSRLKRIRNWRATQAAKKPKLDNQSLDGSFQSLNQDTSLMSSMCDLGAGMYSDPSTSFPLDGSSLSLNGLSNLQSSAFGFPAPISQTADAFLALQAAPTSKHGHSSATLAPQKLTLEKYREKQTELEQRRRHEEEDGDQHRKHGHLTSEPSTSIRLKYNQQQVLERPSKSGSLKRRHPSSSENGSASQEELKMKIKVSSDSSGSSKSRHSPLSSREKHREHSSHKTARHDSSHSHGSHHHHHHHHHHSSKSHRSSKSHSSSASISVNQAIGQPQLAKIDRRMGEGHGSEPNAALINNGPHMDYEDTFNMLDSLLNAQNFQI